MHFLRKPLRDVLLQNEDIYFWKKKSTSRKKWGSPPDEDEEVSAHRPKVSTEVLGEKFFKKTKQRKHMMCFESIERNFRLTVKGLGIN